MNSKIKNKTVSVIIAAAGTSTRFSDSKDKLKQFINLQDKPLLYYSLERFSALKNIVEIIIVTNDIELTNKQLTSINAFKRYENIKVIQGAALRQDSVYNGFCNVNISTDLVLIHDVARPLFNSDDVTKCIEIAFEKGSAILAIPNVDTLKKAEYHNDDLVVDNTIERSNIYLIQTPQVFTYKLLERAYNKIYKGGAANLKRENSFTDEASMIELLGERVNLILGSRKNIKITYPEDLEIAEMILKSMGLNSRINERNELNAYNQTCQM